MRPLGAGLVNVHFLEYVYSIICIFLEEKKHILQRTDTSQLTNIPQLLAEYIQCQYINQNDIYSPMYIFVLDICCQQLYAVYVY